MKNALALHNMNCVWASKQEIKRDQGLSNAARFQAQMCNTAIPNFNTQSFEGTVILRIYCLVCCWAICALSERISHFQPVGKL